MTIWIDGELCAGHDVPRSVGRAAPFETMGACAAQLPLWSRHLQRLRDAAAQLGLAFEPPDGLRAAAADVLLRAGQPDGVLRLALVPVGDGDGVHWVMAARARSPLRVVRLLPTVVERPRNAPPAAIKAEPRRFYDEVRNQAQDGEADDGIVVGDDGAVLEAALGNLWLRCDGVWCTPLLDGRVLPGIARALLLERARAAGVATAERPCTLGDLHAAEALAHSNAVCGPRPAALVGEAAAVAIVDSELGRLWSRALAD